MKINIAEDLDLPVDAVTQSFAEIGRRGSGKTYLASMIAEQMLDIQAQVIVIDVMGIWWGLRVNEDGKSKGKDIYVIGGAHGDIPISAEAGKEIAKILTEKNISVVLDISEFRKNDRKKFVTDFAEEFYHLKKTHPSPVHIFLEESQKFVPQMVMKDDARMLGAWEDIVRLGRNYGIGVSLISQRPQSINKEVLSQVECLCVLQITGLHERKALEEWVQEAGEDRKIVGELPGLNIGEGYVWSPGWLRIFKRVKFNKKVTLDTSATPKLGQATKVAKLSKVDIKKLHNFMDEVIEKTQKDLKDIKDYKNEIARLNKELILTKKGMPPQQVKVDSHAIEKAKRDGFKDAEIQYTKLLSEIKAVNNELKKRQEIYDKSILRINQITESLHFPEMQKINAEIKPVVIPKVEPIKIPEKPQLVTNHLQVSYESDTNKELNLCAKKIYSFLYNNPEREFTKQQLGAVTGYSHKSGGFSNAIYKLNTMGLIERLGSSIKIKSMNPEFAGEYDYSIEAIISKLAVCPRKIYQLLLENPYQEFSKEEIAEKTGYSAGSGGFNNAMYKLNTLGLIERQNNLIKLNPEILEMGK